MENNEDCVSSPLEKKAARKRPRFESHLPTPPPEPLGNSSASSNILTDQKLTSNGENAFGHLSKLHNLVDEILDVRDKSAKLFNRVRQLERVKASRKAHSELEKIILSGQDVQLVDEDVGFAESLLGAMLSSNFETPRRTSNISRASSSTRRGGSRSASIEQRRVSCPITIDVPRRNSLRMTVGAAATSATSASAVSPGSNFKKRPSLLIELPKISKWTRVKAAFKWERASCNTTEGLLDPDLAAKLLRIPENNTPSCEISGPPTPVGTISSSSSVDDVFHRSHRTVERRPRGSRRQIDDSDPSRRSHSLDGEISIPTTFNYLHRTKEAVKTDSRMASHKSPWGKMKDIMQLRRDSLGRQTSRNSRNEDNHSTSSLDSTDVHKAEDGRIPRVRITSDPVGSAAKSNCSQDLSDLKDLASRRLTPTLTITVPSSEELRSLSSPESVTPNERSSEKSSPGPDISRERVSGQISPGSSNSGILRYSLGRSKTSQTVAADMKRQLRSCNYGDSLGSSPKMQRRNSKWNKVKKAFLTSATSVPTSPSRISSYFFDDGDVTTCSYSASASAEDLDNEAATNPAIQAEIQRNYRLLHDKLGSEFYRKLSDWEKLKSTSPALGRSKDSVRSGRERNVENIRLLSEENLTPEFKKKLEEWKKVGTKGGGGGGVTPTESRSLSKRRLTDWQLWRSPSKTESKLDSPRKPSAEFAKKMEEWEKIKIAASRKDEEQYVKKLELEEDEDDENQVTINQWVTQTQSSADRFKTWKGLEDEEFKCLDKIISALEKDQQTRLSKLHRVVGSAPENTQEVLIHTSTGLYRFEGISRKFTRKLYEWEKSQGITPECSTFRLLDPLRYGIDVARPTLTSVAGLSAQTKPRSSLTRSKSVGSVSVDAFGSREEKPSAARRPSSLSLNDMDSIETRNCIGGGSVPTIPDEEDNSEECDIDTELEPEAMIVDIEDVIEETASPLAKYQPHQTPVYSVAGSETTSIAIPLGTVTSSHEPSPTILVEPDEVRPVVAQACIVEQADQQAQASTVIRISEITSRFASVPRNQFFGDGDASLSLMEDLRSLRSSEMAAQDDGKARMESPPPPPSVTSSNQRTEEDEDSVTEVVITVGSNPRHSRKYLKTRRLTDTQVGYEWYQRQSNEPNLTETYPANLKATKESPERMDDFRQGSNREKIIINEKTLNKIVVPTSSGTISTEDTVSLTLKLKNEMGTESKREKRDPRSVLVKTKRIVFSPFKKDSKTKTEPNFLPASEEKCKKFSIPPPPPSPVPPRKEYKTSLTKETAPSIKMMIKMYNEKVEASNAHITPGSATSSGSGSPIWRSPVSERRIRSRMEKYQEEVRKAIASPVYRTANISGIAKSSTIDFTRPSLTKNDSASAVVRSETSPQIFTPIGKEQNLPSTSLRAQMIRKAKQEFLSRDFKRIDHDDHDDNESKRSNFNYIQPLSKADQVKSASVGMINIDPDAFERLQPADSLTLTRNCDSLPKSSDQLGQQIEKYGKESRFHQLASKFRRAKLKRSKDKELGSMSTISMLCRQSLFVDIANVTTTSKSCPTTPSPQYD